MAESDRGQLNLSAAEVYESLFVPALFGRFANPVAEAARLDPNESVLDVACGTGALTRAVRARTTGRVVGVDINPGMIAVAKRHGDDIEFMLGDAMSLDFDDGSFDVGVSQFGFMFLEEPEAGIREMARVASRGLVAVWGPIEQSDGYMAMKDLFRSELGDEAASSLDPPFSMGASGVLESLFEEAGVGRVQFSSIQGTGKFSSIRQWVTTEVRGWTLGDSVSRAQLASLVAKAEDSLSEFSMGGSVEFAMTAKVGVWET